MKSLLRRAFGFRKYTETPKAMQIMLEAMESQAKIVIICLGAFVLGHALVIASCCVWGYKMSGFGVRMAKRYSCWQISS